MAFPITCCFGTDNDTTPEFSHTHGSAGVPTVCCFVPSLTHGSPFQVSLHSWTSYPDEHRESGVAASVKFEARLYIDGRLVS